MGTFLLCVGTFVSTAGLVATATHAFGQTQGAPVRSPQGAKPAEPEERFSPTIGGAGFSVPIPEIKMQSIIGDRAAPKPPPPARQEIERVPSEPAAPRQEAERPAPPTVAPSRDARPEPPAETVEPEQPDETAHEQRLPFEPPERVPEPRKPPLEPSWTKPAPSAATEATGDEDSTRFVGVPTTPEEVLEAPAPVPEALQAKAIPKAPELLEGQTVKGSVALAPLKAAEVGDAQSEEWIPLDTRREMSLFTPRTPGTESQPAAPAEGQPRTDQAQPAGIGPLTPPAEEAAEPEEELPPVEPEPERPLPDVIPSPLDAGALESREVREYLSASVPVLEELSLLMTRVPTLDVADFDPSETDPAAASTDLLMKMDSLKRELQILDSKTFSIIPPSNYTLYHSLFRESITQTYQACESMISFMQNRKEDDLKRVRDHINKARQLLSRTRKSA